jgi:hypothetical protein
MSKEQIRRWRENNPEKVAANRSAAHKRVKDSLSFEKEYRTYHNEAYLRRAWTRLRKSNRFVELSKSDPLTLVVGPPLKGGIRWTHRKYDNPVSLKKALGLLKKDNGVIICNKHHLCLKMTNGKLITSFDNIPEKIETDFSIGDKVKIIHGEMKNLVGSIKKLKKNGVVLICFDLASKQILMECYLTQIMRINDD